VPDICPNELYVATTRASERLSLIHSSDYTFLSFLKTNKLTKYADVVYGSKYLNIRPENMKKPFVFEKGVCDLIRHLSQNIIDECIEKYITIIHKNILDDCDYIEIPHKTEQLDGFESVCEITGVAIPAHFEYLKTGQISIYNKLKMTDKLPENVEFIFPLSVEQLLLLANCWCSYKSKFIFKIFQIQNYNWLSQDILDKAVQNLNTLGISNHAIFEKDNQITVDKMRLSGSIDCIDSDCIYEFKCCQKIEKEHIIQLALYMLLMFKQNETVNHFYLFNIITNELIELKSSLAMLEMMLQDIIRYKYGVNDKMDDDNFIELCKN
jgi:hypothetical protein